MKRTFLLGVYFLLAIMLQKMVMPKWLPIGFIPDFLLLAVLLFGFWKSGASGFWFGLLLGLFQGWIHGVGWWAFALSRGLAAVFVGWMRIRWLWTSPLAVSSCTAVGTVFAETLLAILFAISERSLSPFSLLFTIAAFEASVNSLFAFLISWLKQPREVLA